MFWDWFKSKEKSNDKMLAYSKDGKVHFNDKLLNKLPATKEDFLAVVTESMRWSVNSRGKSRRECIAGMEKHFRNNPKELAHIVHFIQNDNSLEADEDYKQELFRIYAKLSKEGVIKGS